MRLEDAFIQKTKKNVQVLSSGSQFSLKKIFFHFDKLVIFSVYLTLRYGGFPSLFFYIIIYLIPQYLLNIL